MTTLELLLGLTWLGGAALTLLALVQSSQNGTRDGKS
jgi:hypothetical protein